MEHEHIDPDWLDEIKAAQLEPTEVIGGVTYQRVRYGDDFPEGAPTCNDCGVKRGQFHVMCCTFERCARCGGQAWGCPCIEVH